MSSSNRMFHPRQILILAAAMIAVAVISTVTFFNTHSSSSGNSGNDTINVAIGYGPMSLYRYADTLGGFNYEMMRGIAKESGLKVKYHPVSSMATAIADLRLGKYDVVISDLTMTSSQRESVDFTVPVYVDRQVLISRDSTVTSPLELAGLKVWAVEGSPAAERLGNLEREIGDTIYIEATHSYTAEQLAMLVAKGEIERAVINEGVARAMAEHYSDLCISTGISFNQFQAWAVAKGNTTLLDTLNESIERFKSTQAYKELCQKWLGEKD